MLTSTEILLPPTSLPKGDGTVRRSGKRRALRRTLHALALATIGVPLFTALAFSAAVAWWPYPDHLDRPPAPATRVLDRSGVALAAFAAPDGQWRFPLRDD